MQSTWNKIRVAVHYMDALGTVWESWEQLRTGGLVTKVLGGVVVAGRIMKLWLPPESVSQFLGERGYFQVESHLAGKISRLLLNSDLPRTLRVYGEEKFQIHDFGIAGAVVLVWAHGDHSELYALRGAELATVVGPLIWSGQDLAAYFHSMGSFNRPSHVEFDLEALGPVKPYVGDPTVEEVHARIGLSRSRMTTALIVGATGSGKTTLARLLAERARLGVPGMLKIPAHALQQAGSKEVVDAVRLLRPSSLLIDDIPLNGDVNHKLLDLFEALDSAGLVNLVLGTLMADDVDVRDLQQPGRLYWPGMRPGRIDEIILLPPPNASKRACVLSWYLRKAGLPQDRLDAFVGATEGLTGAYLARFVDRLKLHGMEDWEAEVERLRWQSPQACHPAPV